MWGEGEATPSVRFPVGNRCRLSRIIEGRLIKGFSGFREARGVVKYGQTPRESTSMEKAVAGDFGQELQRPAVT